MASFNRILFLALALGFAAASVVLVLWGMSALYRWSESLTPVQHYWLTKAGIAITGLLLALGGYNAYRRGLHR